MSRPAPAAVLAASLTAVLVAGGPAHAEREALVDAPRDAARFGDVVHARTAHGPGALRVKVTFATGGRYADSTQLWIDTRPRRPGPEYVAFATTDELGERSSYVYVDEADGWHDHGDRVCRVRTLTVTAAVPDTVSFTVPRRCLDRPERVRVGYRTSQYAGGVDDHVPAPRTFGRWLARG
jgi:hypothetical protein